MKNHPKKQSLDTRYKYSVHTGPLCQTPNHSPILNSFKKGKNIVYEHL